jgi:hypothetical protein
MNLPNTIRVLFALSMALYFTSCDRAVSTHVFSQISKKEVLSTQTGLKSVLFSAYTESGSQPRAFLYLSMFPSGDARGVGGQIEPFMTALHNFTWSSTNPWIVGRYSSCYQAIRDANIVIDNVSKGDFSSQFKKELTAEAKFIRGWNYAILYNLYGPTPLYKNSSTDSLEKARSTDKEMKNFIAKNLKQAANNLPARNKKDYGRATKGASLGVLCKFYLNTNQWKEASATAKKIIDSGNYKLLNNYSDIFSINNEGNDEILWAYTYKASSHHNNIVALAIPKDYPAPQPNEGLFAARDYYPDKFVNSFYKSDVRKDLLITSYTNTSGQHVQLLGHNKTLSLKYGFDPDASGGDYGNDLIVVRYADILLSRAEALNEIDGPNQESINLINKVRNRAHIPKLNLSEFNSKAALRDSIFQDRKWGFYEEGTWRADEIRHGTFISGAIKRGLNAHSYQKLFPIPQAEIDANPKIKQNSGY